MARNLRFYYRFLLVLLTKKYKQIFISILTLFVLSIFAKFLIYNATPILFNNAFKQISKPRYYEGIIGSVETLNPVYANTLVEKELTLLIFRGLTKIGEDGNIELDLAESFTRASDVKYVLKLRSDQRWHDGEKITADDVIYTINLTQKTNPPSEFSADFKDVKVTKLDDYTVEFKLAEPFSPFILNTTLGIVPKHIKLEEYRPVGSGEFQVKEISKEKVVLESDFAVLIFKLYQSKEDALLALKLGEIDAVSGLSFFDLEEFQLWPNINFYSSDLRQRQVILFFNLKDKILEEKNMRRALALATPKELIAQVLPGFNQKISYNSLPLENWGGSLENQNIFDQSKSQTELESLGWEKEDSVRTKKEEKLTLTITTSSEPELKKVAEVVASSWRSVGASVDLRVVRPIDLKEKVIPERDFQALLTIQRLNADPDQYSLWHSSQTNAGNITSLESDRIDKILEDGRKIFDNKKRRTQYVLFNRILVDEAPAIFLYYPKYFWLVNKRISNISLSPFNQTSDRFKTIQKWKFSSPTILGF